jgi:hypothetical protein
MSDDTKDAERLAQLEAEVAALKAAQPKPQPSAEEIERSMARARDELHQMREGRMSLAMPPSVHQYFADGVTAADCADLARAAHAPTGPSSAGAIPSSQQVTGVHPHGGPLPQLTPGWGYSPPLSNPPGTGPGSAADRIVDEFDRRDRAELVEREARLRAMQQLAERNND